MTEPEIRKLLADIDALIGVAAALPQYRNDIPSAEATQEYATLKAHVDAGMERLEADGVELVNPNGHAMLAAMWAAMWSLGSSGRDRREYPARLYADLKDKLNVHAAALRNAGGGPVGTEDELTGLLNRGAFNREIQSLMEDSVASGAPLSLVLVDIDHFKRVNDDHGHQAGDAVLRGVSDRLAAVCHRKGNAFRYGGEEIALVLRNHAEQEALAVAERARVTVEREPINDIRVTASFGIATTPPGPNTAADLIGAADRALYDAKNRGRNLVRLHGEPPPAQPGPRSTARREPPSGKLTEAQKTEMRRRVLQHQRIECPDDGAPLEVIDATSVRAIGKEFLIHCPDCGFSDRLPGPAR